MKLRKDILPVIEPPNLSVEVELRAMISHDVTRLAEIPEVREKLNSLDDGTPSRTVNVTLMVVASGVDSATEFAHYDQKGAETITEHMMSLTLVADGEDLWVNPNPQSDVFCHVKSMGWVEENDQLTKNIYDKFVNDVHDINENPIILQFGAVQLKINVNYIYSPIDGKAANAIVLNGYTQAFPLTR